MAEELAEAPQGGQSRPNPTYAPSVGTADYFSGTPELLTRHFARLGENAPARRERSRRKAVSPGRG